MKHLFLIIILISASLSVLGQDGDVARNKLSSSVMERWDLKKYIWSNANYKMAKEDNLVLDFEAVGNWRSLGTDGDLSISPNGEFFAHSIKNNHLNFKVDSIIVQSIKGDWRRTFAGNRAGFFSPDSRQYILLSEGNLTFLSTGGEINNLIKGVADYKFIGEWLAYLSDVTKSTVVLKNLVTGSEKHFTDISRFNFDKSGMWFTCNLKTEHKELRVCQLGTGKEFRFDNVEDYQVASNGKSILVKTVEKSKNRVVSLKYLQLSDLSEKAIWSATDSVASIINYSFDPSGCQVVFLVKNGMGDNCIWYYNSKMGKAIMKVSNQSEGISPDLSIQYPPAFTNNGRYIIFFVQKRPDSRKANTDETLLDVWSYKDTFLQATQTVSLPRAYRMAMQTDGSRIVRLENEFEHLKILTFPSDYTVVAKSYKFISGDKFWEKENRFDSNWLISLENGSRRLLPTRSFDRQGDNFWISPGGNYLVFFDAEQGYNYFTYNLKTGKQTNISLQVPRQQLAYENYFFYPKGEKTSFGNTNYGVAAWLQDDKGVLVYDDYDIWHLDLSGTNAPRNITDGYGRNHNVVFNLAIQDDTEKDVVLASTDTLLLNAFNRSNKENGFYQKVLNESGGPKLLYLGPYFFQSQRLMEITGFDNGMKPLRATGSKTWIVKRQSVTDPPNYFVTNNFKSFNRLTNIQSQVGYNWLTAELHSFRQIDGTISQGVLYKPTNFDPAKKNPTIISFYFNHSDQLHRYPFPELFSAPADYFNPAWFASQGYLVFCPDIYFRDKAWGPSTLNTMDGAARYLGQLPYVDRKKIGLSGHSNSGRMGYYVLTHSRSFAAMSIGSGAFGPNLMSSALSFEGGLNPSGNTLEPAELDLGSLWENKDIWLDHTAVLNADKAVSPLLLLFNDKDSDPVTRGRELFLSLWRTGKKVWWLNYNREGHTIDRPNAQKDYTVRYTQFFDHYLKEAPAPSWMTKGIPYKLKGIESRYNLDASGTCALEGKSHCYTCEAWNQQYKRNPSMFQKEIKDWALDKDIQAELDKKQTVERKRLDKEGEVEQKRIADILKNGYPEDEKRKKAAAVNKETP